MVVYVEEVNRVRLQRMLKTVFGRRIEIITMEGRTDGFKIKVADGFDGVVQRWLEAVSICRGYVN